MKVERLGSNYAMLRDENNNEVWVRVSDNSRLDAVVEAVKATFSGPVSAESFDTKVAKAVRMAKLPTPRPAAPRLGRTRSRFAATPELVRYVREIAMQSPEMSVSQIWVKIGSMSEQWVRNVISGETWTKDKMTPTSPYYDTPECLTREEFAAWRDRYMAAATGAPVAA